MLKGAYREYQPYFRNRPPHWSRIVEYPWVMIHGGFIRRDWVLDAAGGNGPVSGVLRKFGCEVVNIDLDLPQFRERGVCYVQGNLKNITYPDEFFHRVVCVSVLEHVDDPHKAVEEMWRVLRPGGRLIVTLDVADKYRWNHTIDLDEAKKIVRKFNMTVPPQPHDILTMRLPEYMPAKEDPRSVLLKVLCFWVDKE